MNIYLIIFSLQLQQDRSQMISMLTGSARKFNFQNKTVIWLVLCVANKQQHTTV